jgi:hypothetical protein
MQIRSGRLLNFKKETLRTTINILPGRMVLMGPFTKK